MKIIILRKKTIIILIVFLIIFSFLYKYSPRRIEFLGHYDKVYAHRVNSLEKQKEALRYFDGIELDLVYNKGKNVLDVNHPPTKSIDLSFETYLSKIKLNDFPFLWLDIKTLDTTNADAIFLKLNTLLQDKKYPKNRILIETRSPEALKQFSASGYKTSYYLKPRLHQKKNEELLKEINVISSVLKLQPTIGISSSYEDYALMKMYFPKKIKYIWALSSPYRFKYNKVREILNDEKVEVVLSNFQSTSGNR